MTRRLVVACLLACSLLFAPALAWAGSYLDRAALLLDGSQAERDMVRPRVHDRELCRLVHEIAAARVEAAGRMTVPPEVAPAHPHLLLVLENTERALAAACEGNYERFVEHIDRAREEDSTFRAVIAKLGFTLPTTP